MNKTNEEVNEQSTEEQPKKQEEIKEEKEQPENKEEKKEENKEDLNKNVEPTNEKKDESNYNPEKKSLKKPLIIAAIVFVVVIAVAMIAAVIISNAQNNSESGNKKQSAKVDKVEYSENTIKGNSLDNFDISFLKLENKEENKIYSPLSIKYALSMLSDGADGQSYNQIKSIIGDYKYKKYTNSANLSLANALFVKNSYKESIKEDYVNKLKKNYDADVVYDSFETADPINNWVKGKTLNLIDKLFDNVSDKTFILVNALAIDMEWVNKLHRGYSVEYANEEFSAWVSGLESSGYPKMKFDNSTDVQATHIKANANRYNIVKELGEDKIRKEVGEAYQAWLDKDECGTASTEPSVEEYLDQYIKDLDSNYGKVSSSTDFYFHDDDEVKVFGKDLKEYDGTTLEYVAIMPKNVSLKEYINKLDAEEATKVIQKLKEIKLENFKDGVVTDLDGGIPLFNYEYKLSLMEDLEKLGIKDIFDKKTANLSKLTSEKEAYIGTAIHKSTINFSNEGIKAAAATAMGGYGAAGCYFTYKYEVPVEKIDLMFDKPYIYFILNKDNGEVWFTGTVYQPTKINEIVGGSGYDGMYSLNEEKDR